LAACRSGAPTQGIEIARQLSAGDPDLAPCQLGGATPSNQFRRQRPLVGLPRDCSQAQVDQGKGVEIMSTNTIKLHRVIRARPEKIYRAFIDADAKVKWLPPNGFTGKIHHMDARVGGTYKMSFANFTTGRGHMFSGTFIELTPHERIRYTDKFDDPNLPGEMQVAVALKTVSCGTEMNIVQEGVPDVIPPEACYLGWQESLALLAKLVESDIPD
jgi:uncharacterized protein YndB with AHSA1/START domain